VREGAYTWRCLHVGVLTRGGAYISENGVSRVSKFLVVTHFIFSILYYIVVVLPCGSAAAIHFDRSSLNVIDQRTK
jgi:hypothetical protein